jgi:hypothetical protein
MNNFERDGIAFRYPADWVLELTEDPESGGWTATATSPETAFFMVSLQPDASDAGDLADQALDSLKSEYKELDAENVMETICGLPAIGFNADFLTVDTAIICRARALDTFAGPLLLLAQVSEYDREKNDPVLLEIVKSLDVEADR